jgi:hypothetical protein
MKCENFGVILKTLIKLVICIIWYFHGGDYEECRLLGCYAVWLFQGARFRKNVAPPTLAITGNRRTVPRNTNIIPSLLIFVTLMLEAPRYSETSVLSRTTRRNKFEDGVLQMVNLFLRWSVSHIGKGQLYWNEYEIGLKRNYRILCFGSMRFWRLCDTQNY